MSVIVIRRTVVHEQEIARIRVNRTRVTMLQVTALAKIGHGRVLARCQVNLAEQTVACHAPQRSLAVER